MHCNYSGLFLKNNAPANNYKNPDTLNIQDKQSMMMADKAVEKIARGTSGKFETLYLGADGQFQWNILNPEETSFKPQHHLIRKVIAMKLVLYDKQRLR